jgi:tyrosine-specific transport protein
MALPIIFCSFGYHQVIPLVCKQLNYDTRAISRAMVVGTLIPLAFNAVILTIGFGLFTGEELAQAANLGISIFVLQTQRPNHGAFLYVCQLFSFFAIATSMLGISMAMKGALQDIFKSQKILHRLVELFIVLPLLPAIFKPQLFFIILGVAGGIFGNLIAGLLPLTIFLRRGRFRPRYLVLWSVFAFIFAIECAQLFSRGRG